MLSIGALGGLGFVSAGLGTQLVVGVNGDYKLAPTYGVGVYFSYDSLAAASLVAGINASSSLISFLPEANYYFDGQLTGFRIGGKVGLGWINYNPNVAGSSSTSTTTLAVGPHIGYDYPVGGGLTFGGEANMIFYTADNGFNAINLLANLKYWF